MVKANSGNDGEYLDVKEQIDAVYGLVETDDINLALLMLRCVTAVPLDSRGEILQYLFERQIEYSAASQSKQKKLDATINSNEARELEDRYGNVIYYLLEMLLSSKPSTKDFYQKIAAQLLANPIFDTEPAQAFALYRLMIDRRIPYFELDEGFRMSTDDWVALGRSVSHASAKIRFILAADIRQRSAQSDLILRVLDEHQGAARIRLMASTIYEIQDREKQARTRQD